MYTGTTTRELISFSRVDDILFPVSSRLAAVSNSPIQYLTCYTCNPLISSMLSSTLLKSTMAARGFVARRPSHGGCFFATTTTTTTTTQLCDSYDNIMVQRNGAVGVITLHRPKALNALSDDLFQDLIHAATAFDHDDTIGCLVLTGSDKAFAAGADISEMQHQSFAGAYQTNMFQSWQNMSKLSKPVIAAVNGFCLGGGCELAMMCDILLAGDRAKFGQPEINLGVIPGAGGTQRLTRAIGKSKAMHMCLTGDFMSAVDAERAGLVAKVYPAAELLDEAVKMAQKIASKGRMSVLMAKEAVNAADELSLQEGLRFERRLFHSLFATEDQKEGMSAFLEKRDAEFKGK
jgi:enoyl-CoA hydratase/carnithine racemase